MKKLFSFIAIAIISVSMSTASAQLVEGKRGSEDFKIGVAGYSYRSFDIDQTLSFLQSMGHARGSSEEDAGNGGGG